MYLALIWSLIELRAWSIPSHLLRTFNSRYVENRKWTLAVPRNQNAGAAICVLKLDWLNFLPLAITWLWPYKLWLCLSSLKSSCIASTYYLFAGALGHRLWVCLTSKAAASLIGSCGLRLHKTALLATWPHHLFPRHCRTRFLAAAIDLNSVTGACPTPLT